MALTNPTKLINLQELAYFEGKLAGKYQTQGITAITGMDAETVEGALAELLGKIDALPAAIVPKGTKTFSQLAPSTDLVAANVGFMWNISDAFTTTSDFAEGAGKSIPAGANIYVANVGTAQSPSYKYDIFQGMYDLSGYALKSEMSVEDGTGTDADKTTITLKSGTSATVLKTHQDISGKADKVASATSGNFAGLDANGNLTDSGSKASDFATAAQGEKADTAYQLPSGGVPKSDLAQGVQDSLDAADSAYQKPNTGIAKSDLAQGVQDSLDAADSAVQSVAEGSTNGTIAVDGTDVAVHGLGSAAYAATTDFQANVGIAANSDIDEIFA